MSKAAASLEPGPPEFSGEIESRGFDLPGLSNLVQRIECIAEAERVLGNSDAFVLITRHGKVFGRIGMYESDLLLYAEEAVSLMRSEFCGGVEEGETDASDNEEGN